MLVKIETYFDGEMWCARGTSDDVFTQATTYDELLGNIKEAVGLHFEDWLTQGKTVEVLILSEMEVTGVPEAATA